LFFNFFVSVSAFQKFSSDYWGESGTGFPILIIGGACPGCPQSLRLCLSTVINCGLQLTLLGLHY